MRYVTLILMGGFLTVGLALTGQAESPLRFDRQRIGDTTFEACSIFDVNNDGKLDLFSGGYWHEGPDFATAHKVCELQEFDTYFDAFSDYPMDVNGDGYLDIISGGWFGKTFLWRENPKGGTGEWTTHNVAETGNIERGCFWDLNGDGQVEAVPNLPGNPFIVFELVRDEHGRGTGEFNRYDISPVKQGHGLGFGDINGDGRGDLVSASGWLEAPENPFSTDWVWHAEFEFGGASVPTLVYDVNSDGKNDLIVGQGHDYGLAWYEQTADAAGARGWIKHDIETERSQFHEMLLADLNLDGAPELVTGKRWHAHNGHDPGGADPVGLYYYTIENATFTRHTIDYGDAGKTSGTGLYLWVDDVDTNGLPDILAPGKEGLYLFKQMSN